MNDIVYLVCYDGVHQVGILFATSNENLAIEEADKAQGFRVEKWVDGRKVEHKHYDGNAITGALR